MKKNHLEFWAAATGIFFLLVAPSVSSADDNSNFYYIGNGFSRILTSVFQIPRFLISKTFSEPPLLGTVDGALTGTLYAVNDLSGGLLEILRGVIPYAKYAPFFFL